MFETLSKFLINGKDLNPSLIATVGFLALFFNLKSIYDFLDGISNRKAKTLINLINEKEIDESTKKILKEELSSVCFKYTTGIKVEKHLREEIIRTHDELNGRISYRDFKYSRSFLTIKEDGSLGLRKVGILEKIYYFASLAGGFLFLFFSIFTFSLILAFPNQIANFRVFLSLIFLGLVFFIYFLFFSSQTFPVKAVTKIRREMHFIKTHPSYSLTVDTKNEPSSGLPYQAKLDKAWERWLSEVEQLEVEPPNTRPDEYEQALIDKYTKQGLI
jgi:hypothetical protein